MLWKDQWQEEKEWGGYFINLFFLSHTTHPPQGQSEVHCGPRPGVQFRVWALANGTLDFNKPRTVGEVTVTIWSLCVKKMTKTLRLDSGDLCPTEETRFICDLALMPMPE